MDTINFKSLWADGNFDECTYYALTAPLDEWSTEYPTYCISEQVGALAENGWGIVHYKLVVYLYSDLERATIRAKQLGENVKPMQLKCIACFIHALSTHRSFADVILDERWHLETLVCRENELSPWNQLGYGALHVRLHNGRDLFELAGCAGNNTLEWRHLVSYGDRRNNHEWCRPVSHPQGTLMIDHSPQGGPVDVEFVSPANSLKYFNLQDQEFAISEEPTQADTIYARPVSALAFAQLLGEKIQITESGIWIPVAKCIAKNWQVYPWANDLKGRLSKLSEVPENLRPDQHSSDPGCLCNQALFELESSCMSDDKDVRKKGYEKAKKLLAMASALQPTDWYARGLYEGICSLTPENAKALVHADRISWETWCQDYAAAEREYKSAIEIKSDLQLGYHNYAIAANAFGDSEAHHSALTQLLKINPTHVLGNYDMAISYLSNGDEEKEVEHYFKALDGDSTHSQSLYNLAKTYQDWGEINKAMDFYFKAVDANPAFPEAHENMAYIFQANEMFDEAEIAFLKALMSNPRRQQTYKSIIQFCQETGRESLKKTARNIMEQELPRENFM